MSARTCARIGCSNTFAPDSRSGRQRFCCRSCAATARNAERAGDPAYSDERMAAINSAVEAWTGVVGLRPPPMPAWAYDFIEHIGRVPTARYLEALYAGRRYDA